MASEFHAKYLSTLNCFHSGQWWEFIEHRWTKINKTEFIEKYVKDSELKIEDLQILFFNNNPAFINLLDSDINLIGFENGIYSVDKKVFRSGTSNDYISLSTGTIFDTDLISDELIQKLFDEIESCENNNDDEYVENIITPSYISKFIRYLPKLRELYSDKYKDLDCETVDELVKYASCSKEVAQEVLHNNKNNMVSAMLHFDKLNNTKIASMFNAKYNNDGKLTYDKKEANKFAMHPVDYSPLGYYGSYDSYGKPPPHNSNFNASQSPYTKYYTPQHSATYKQQYPSTFLLKKSGSKSLDDLDEDEVNTVMTQGNVSKHMAQQSLLKNGNIVDAILDLLPDDGPILNISNVHNDKSTKHTQDIFSQFFSKKPKLTVHDIDQSYVKTMMDELKVSKHDAEQALIKNGNNIVDAVLSLA